MLGRQGREEEGRDIEDYYLPLKKKEILSFVTWMNQEECISQVNKASRKNKHYTWNPKQSNL